MTLPRLRAAFFCVLSAALIAGCGGGGGGGGGGSNPPPDGGAVTPSARVGWDQLVPGGTALESLRFVMYIDGVRTDLPQASCSTPAASAGYPCESPLPTMSNGQHTIQLASYFGSDPIAESPKSASLVITMTGASGSLAGSVTIESTASMPPVPAPAAVPVRNLTTADGARLRIDVVARVDQPAALAVSGDGAVLVADRSGVVRVVRDGRLAGETSVGVDGTDRGGILDLALDPQFPTSHWVYVLDATAGDAPRFRVSRFREAGGRLGERAVLLDAVPASGRPSAALAFGSDGRLYAAFDDGGNPDSAQSPSSYSGKVLRLNADGSTPDDQPGGTPIYASSLQSPRSLAWDSSTASLWLADGGPRLAKRIRGSGKRAAVVTPYRLPLAEGPASIAIYRGGLIPLLQGNLLVAPAEDATYLLRARFTSADQSVVGSTEQLAIPGGSFVRLVKVGPDGAIYVGTDSAVLKIVPR